MVSANPELAFDTERAIDLPALRRRRPDSERVPFRDVDTFEGVSSDPLTLHKYAYTHDDPVNNIDPSGNITMPQLLVGVGLSVLLGAIIGAGLGAVGGGATAAYLHIVQYKTFDGIWDSISAGAAYGAIQGAIIGGAAGSGNPVLLASALSATFGYNIGQAIPVYSDPTVNAETKVAITFLLLIQGKATVAGIKTTFAKHNISPQMYVTEALRYSKLSVENLRAKVAPPMAGRIGEIFGTAEAGAEARLALARDGKLPIPPGLTRDALLAYREIALRQIAELGPDRAKVQVDRVLIIEEVLPQVKE